MNNQILLLKTMLLSTSNRNILKYSDDKKKRGLATGNIIGPVILHVLIAIYVGAMCYGMAFFGMADTVPAVPAVLITAISFLFTLLKAHGMLFGYKEYDMLMSMPFPTKAVVADRFLFMYLKNLSWTCVVSLASLIAYAVVAKPGVLTYVLWILLTFLLPVLPMLLAVAISALIGGIGSGFRHKNLVLTILTFVFVIPLFFLQYFINDIIENDKIESMMDQSASVFSAVDRFVPTIGWFSKAVNDHSLLSVILLIVTAVAAYEIVFIIFSKFYKSINSRMSSHSMSHEKVKNTDLKARNVVKSIAFKEFKLFTGCVAYITNVGMGVVMAVIFGIVVLFVDPSFLVSMVAGTPVDVSAVPIVLIIPVFIYFFTGMVPSTACSMSLEGKNFWIIKSLPLDMMDVFKGKMLFNILLFLPAALFCTISSCISLKASPVEFLVAVLYTCSTCLFSTVFGMYCGAKHMRLDWETEIQVIKQGRAVSSYLLPNMLGTMILGGGLVAVGLIFNILPLVMTAFSAIYLLLTIPAYFGVKKLSKII
ncbi:MAG: hypothetical protein IKS11_07745 [Lachnospiraceae bacterium]|nr:hypothetical protein [Lachnospiraceae bacterium]